MWILILGLSLILGFGLMFLSDWSEVLEFMAVLMFFPFFLSLIGILWTGADVAGGRVINEKIELYQTENKNIEQQIDQVIKNYMDYEKETFSTSKGESSITLVSLYPELKSDKLVKKQIDLYTENKETITKLKEEKINLKVSKWWLYFGK